MWERTGAKRSETSPTRCDRGNHCYGMCCTSVKAAYLEHSTVARAMHATCKGTQGQSNVGGPLIMAKRLLRQHFIHISDLPWERGSNWISTRMEALLHVDMFGDHLPLTLFFFYSFFHFLCLGMSCSHRLLLSFLLSREHLAMH